MLVDLVTRLKNSQVEQANRMEKKGQGVSDRDKINACRYVNTYRYCELS